MKRILSIIIMFIMTITFTACDSGDSELIKTDLENPVVIKWVMPGPGKQTDSEMVWKKFNEDLKKISGFENVSVDFEIIQIDDYKHRISAINDLGEKIDILHTYTLDYAKELRNGKIIDMGPYLEKYAKETIEELPEWLIDMGKIDEAQAIVPNYNKMVMTSYSAVLPASLVDKYEIDVEKLSTTLKTDYEGWGWMSRDAIEEYLAKVYEGGDIRKGFVEGRKKGTDTIIDKFEYYIADPEVNVVYSNLETQQWQLWRLKKYFYDKNYARNNLISDAPEFSKIVDGKAFFTTVDWSGKNTPFLDETAFDIPVYIVPFDEKFYIPYKPEKGGLAISSESQYPDIAAGIINLMNSEEGKDLYNLLVYGVEGTHYKVDKYLFDDKIITPIDYVEDGEETSKYGLWKWIVGNPENAYITSNNNENYKDVVYSIMNEGENTLISKLLGFAVDDSTIAPKFSQLSDIENEYNPLLNQLEEDIETKLAEMHTKYTDADVYQITDEIQRQVDKFLETK